MIKACDLKKTSIVEIDGMPHCIESIAQQAPSARGGSTLYKVRFRNVSTQQKTDKTFRGEDTLQEAYYDTVQVQYLYRDGDRHTFMDLESYEQFELTDTDVSSVLPYLIEDMDGITALISNGKVLTLRVPDVIELEITECDPSIKGASATARTKPATLATGLVVQVPEYISQGDTIKIDTREDKFLSRA